MKHWVTIVCQFKCYCEEHEEICVIFIFIWWQGLGNLYSCWRKEIHGFRWPRSHLWRQDNWVVLFDFPPPGPFDSVRKRGQGLFDKSSDEARSRVGGAKIECNTFLLVREDCWREFQVAALVGYPLLGFRKLCSKEVPKISSSEEPLWF